MNLITGKIPRENITLLAICLGGLVIFVLAGIIPLHQAIAKLDARIKSTGVKIEEQRDFAPIFAAFQDRIRKGEKKFGGELVIPTVAKLPREQVQDLSQVVRDASARAGLVSVSVTPQLNMVESTGSVSVSHVIKGSYLGFRKYLIYIAQLPYYEKIDSIKIEETASGLEYTVKLKVILA